nr:uncharacterized protein LOC109151226 [Ipomoea batatas]
MELLVVGLEVPGGCWCLVFSGHYGAFSVRVFDMTKQVTDRDLLLKPNLDREEKLKQELEDLKKRIKMMDNTSTLDQILDAGRQSTTKYGIGFTSGLNKGKTTFVGASGPNTDILESSSARRGCGKVFKTTYNYKIYNPVCHYCRIHGHTRSECLYSYKDQRAEKYSKKHISPFIKQIWVRKSDYVCHVSFHTKGTCKAEK